MEGITISRSSGVTTLRLNRPKEFNTLTTSLLDGLTTAFMAAGHDPACRVIVLTGESIFSAGQDLNEVLHAIDDPSATNVRDHLEHHYLPLLEKLVRSPVPTIAAIPGGVAGAGMSLTLACDMRICTKSAYFRPGFVAVGLVPDCGMSVLLPKIIGRGRALSAMLVDSEIGGDEAEAMGLVRAAVPDDRLYVDTATVAHELATGPASTRLIRQMTGEALWRELREGFEREASYQSEAIATADAREGISAFLEHRSPKFTGE